jgi:uncharacterized UPF0146 family protein
MTTLHFEYWVSDEDYPDQQGEHEVLYRHGHVKVIEIGEQERPRLAEIAAEYALDILKTNLEQRKKMEGEQDP